MKDVAAEKVHDSDEAKIRKFSNRQKLDLIQWNNLFYNTKAFALRSSPIFESRNLFH